MLEAFTFAIFAAIVTVLIVSNLGLRMKNLKRKSENASLQMAQKQIETQVVANKVQDMDGFVKFLSESRDSAFEYIEMVQLAIEQLNNAMEANDEEKINEAYSSLIAFLPDKTTND